MNHVVRSHTELLLIATFLALTAAATMTLTSLGHPDAQITSKSTAASASERPSMGKSEAAAPSARRG